MVISILGITAFLLYWLKQSYDREKNTLNIKTEVVFRETILQLQVAKLKLDGLDWNGKDSSKGKMKIVMHEKDGEQVRVRFQPGEEIVSTINVVTIIPFFIEMRLLFVDFLAINYPLYGSICYYDDDDDDGGNNAAQW